MSSNHTPSDKNIPDTWTILKLISWTEGYFKDSDIDSPRLTAEILLCHSLNIRRLDLYLQFDRPLNKDELTRYKSLIMRRVRKEPVAYITGFKGFWDSQFSVTPDVLIPRPDTETLVEVALNLIKQKKIEQNKITTQDKKIAQNKEFALNKESAQDKGVIQKYNEGSNCKQNITVLELGTGSGAIAISLAKENPDVIFFATDISPKAALIAANNSNDDLGSVLGNLFFLTGSWFSPIRSGTRFDIIVSNPPYIPTDDIKALQQEVRDYEPFLALDGGQDGISCLREIMEFAPDYLAPEGVLLMEMGFDQKKKVENEALKISKYETPVFIKDYAGHHRVVSLKIKSIENKNKI